jgi:hypothetical protein
MGEVVNLVRLKLGIITGIYALSRIVALAVSLLPIYYPLIFDGFIINFTIKKVDLTI